MRFVLPAAFLLLTSCGDDSDDDAPVDVSGVYTISATTTANACNYPTLPVGQSTTNITFDVKQTRERASATIQGGVAGLFFASLGMGELVGPVRANKASLSATGTVKFLYGVSCWYQVRATTDIELVGDTLTGTTTYSNQTDLNPACGLYETCTATQTLSGTRPTKTPAPATTPR